jgi:hypothetical protein
MDVNLIAKSLQKNWKTWPVLKRSRALNVLHLAGWSSRKLAALVGCSATQVLNVMRVDKLSPLDKVRVAAGESMKKAVKNHKARQKQERVSKLNQEVKRGCRLIQFWFQAVQVPACYEEQILIQLLAAERGEALERNLDYPNLKIAPEELVERSKPKEISSCSNIDIINAWVYWLCGFSRVGIPKWEVRELALMMALSTAGEIAYKPVLH